VIGKGDVQFIIPVFNLKEHRLKNFAFIFKEICKLGCKIYVAEQTNKPTLAKHSILWNIIKDRSNVKYVNFISDKTDIHKTALINWVVLNYVTSEYFWVNDADCYIKFYNIFEELTERYDFIKPYSVAKKLNEEESNNILNGGSIVVDFNDKSREYISLFGALSFVCKKNIFKKVGWLDEDFIGAGHEDYEFCKRVEYKKYKIKELIFKSIHLYHPVNIEKYNETIKEHNKILEKKHNYLFNKKTKEKEVEKQEYSFTADKVTMYEKNWFKFLSHLKDVKANGLEMGSFEGRASIWFLDNILTHKKSTITCIDKWLPDSKSSAVIEKRFLHNIIVSKYFPKVDKLKGDNAQILPELIINKKNNFYDFIYLNGDCKCFNILRDLCYCHHLIKIGGVMIINNYSTKVVHKVKTPTTTKAAIDAFLESYSFYYDVLSSDYQLVLKRVNKPVETLDTNKSLGKMSRATHKPIEIREDKLPSVEITTDDCELAKGSYFSLNTDLKNKNEKVMYQWYKNNIMLECEIKENLNLGFIDNSDTGSYKVEVTNINGSIFSKPVTIIVK